MIAHRGVRRRRRAGRRRGHAAARQAGQPDRRPAGPADRRRARPRAKDALAKEPACSPSRWTTRRAFFETFFERFGNIDLLFEQADTHADGRQACWLISACMAVGGIVLGVVLRHPLRACCRWSACCMGVAAADLAAVPPQTAAEGLRRATARRPGNARPRAARRAEPGLRLQHGGHRDGRRRSARNSAASSRSRTSAFRLDESLAEHDRARSPIST